MVQEAFEREGCHCQWVTPTRASVLAMFGDVEAELAFGNFGSSTDLGSGWMYAFQVKTVAAVSHLFSPTLARRALTGSHSGGYACGSVHVIHVPALLRPVAFSCLLLFLLYPRYKCVIVSQHHRTEK
jgi:hypothetical protein